MTSGPFRSRLDRGVLTLVLDTPGSDVNVFDLRAAEQLSATMADLPRAVQVVVLASAKPRSWVNGVGLMMAGAVKDPSDVARLTAPVRAAYRAVREAKVPTVAAIRGSCFGCGVELAMQCSHRVAVADGPTEFYMTELADYLFVPCFGATQDLPRLVGLERAIELLLDGARWSAPEAARAGLVDRAVDMQGADEAVAELVEEVRRGEIAPARERTAPAWSPACLDAAWLRTGELPAAASPPYAQALTLLEQGARGARAYDQEVEAAGVTLMRPESKAAQGFFFLRHVAARRVRRGLRAPARTLVLAGLPVLGDTLRRRAPGDLAIADAPAATYEPGRLLLASSGGPGVDAVLSTGSVPPGRDGERPAAWGPSGTLFFEIDEASRPHTAAALADALARAGIEAVRTRPGDRMVSARLGRAVLDPVAAFLLSGGSAADATRTLRRLGFVRSPAALARAIGSELPAAAPGGEASEALADAVSLSLIAAVRELLSVTQEVDHPSSLDLLARHAIDFPLSESSLCRFATVARARALLDHASATARSLLTAPTLCHVEDHAAHGRDPYC